MFIVKLSNSCDVSTVEMNPYVYGKKQVDRRNYVIILNFPTCDVLHLITLKIACTDETFDVHQYSIGAVLLFHTCLKIHLVLLIIF